MKRRKAREYALQMLYQAEFTGQKPDPRVFFRDRDESAEVMAFAGEIMTGTLENIEAIDRAIEQAAEHWVLDRMAAVDRNLMRAAAYELIFRKDIPSAVSINEALEIAKKYSSSEAASFINGILDRISRSARSATA